jgi:hypothetical protein
LGTRGQHANHQTTEAAWFPYVGHPLIKQAHADGVRMFPVALHYKNAQHNSAVKPSGWRRAASLLTVKTKTFWPKKQTSVRDCICVDYTGQQNLTFCLSHEEKYLILIVLLTLNSNM